MAGEHKIDFGDLHISVTVGSGYGVRYDQATGRWLRRDTATKLVDGVLVTTDSGEYEIPSPFGE